MLDIKRVLPVEIKQLLEDIRVPKSSTISINVNKLKEVCLESHKDI